MLNKHYTVKKRLLAGEYKILNGTGCVSLSYCFRSDTDVRIGKRKWKLKRNKFGTDVSKWFGYLFISLIHAEHHNCGEWPKRGGGSRSKKTQKLLRQGAKE